MPRLKSRASLHFFILLLAGQILSACTSMVAHLSLEPYIKDKEKRNAIELIAENYCRQKRNYPGATGVKTRPDFIFTTDGCSRAPDDHWAACCIAHDIPYWCGGSEKDREAADWFLKQCVNRQESIIGNLYYAGTRLGGSPWLPTPWRWGYGWDDWPRGYEKLELSPPVIQLLHDLNVKALVQQHLQKKPF